MKEIRNCTDPAFARYGRVIEGYEVTEVLDVLRSVTPCPEGVVYEPTEENMEKTPLFKELQEGIYGGMPIEFGYCNGHNTKLNALEYHKGSELNIAADEVILLVALLPEISPEKTLSTDAIEAFRVPKGTMVELYETTLHYAPCQASEEGFRVVIVLPRGTNFPLETKPTDRDGEEKLITAVNKWLIAHPEGGCGDAFCGLTGKNLDVTEDFR